jgi:phenylacetate-CoA ligase
VVGKGVVFRNGDALAAGALWPEPKHRALMDRAPRRRPLPEPGHAPGRGGVAGRAGPAPPVDPRPALSLQCRVGARAWLRGWTGALRSPRGAREDLVSYQTRCLRALIPHAYSRVAYYRRLFDDAGVDPRQIRSIEDLARIPTTSREDLQASSPADLCDAGARIDSLLVTRTSGSTGAPLTVRRTAAEERLLLAFRFQATREFGLRFTMRRVQIDYFSPEALRREGGRTFYQRLGIHARLLIDWRTPKHEMLDRIERFRPHVLSGPPSILSGVASELTDQERRRIGVHLVTTGGETVTPSVRQLLERAFGAPVIERYGSHELVFIAVRPPGGRGYRVCEDALVVEVLRDGKPVRPGERGEIVLTSLHLFAMPFIRYRLGDEVTLADAGHEHPAGYTTLGSIDGRSIDRFLLPDGSVVHPYTFSSAIERSGVGVRQFQVIQAERDAFQVRVVLLRGQAADVGALARCLRDALPATVSVQVEVVESLQPATPRKLRTYITYESLATRKAGGGPP